MEGLGLTAYTPSIGVAVAAGNLTLPRLVAGSARQIQLRRGSVRLPAATATPMLSVHAVRPNPSIEGTCSGLRPPHAPHVKR